ncbi:MAG: histidine triad (HIT) [Beijerinckiaceae bacterium]|nr:MAG: histidine triad (HIT) [Beijerinckiaceae bacterium]
MQDQHAAEAGFGLDPRLHEIGHPIGDFPLCHVFLLDDARFPWVMLVPRRAGISEILDLAEADQQLLFGEIMRAAKALQAVSKPDKLNIGALGNIVRQLHVHIIGRFQSDPAWPGPVWGHGERMPYPPHMVGPLVDRLAKTLGL